MRRRRHVLLFILFLTCLLWAVLTALQSLPKWMGGGDVELQKRIAVSNSSFVYVLKPMHWLEFNLPADTDSIRLISNASIANSLPTESTDSWQYALDYQLLDSDGHLLRENTYHKRTGLNRVEDSVTGAHFSPTFYLSDELAPLDGQSILLNLSGAPNVDRLRIRLADSDPAIVDVAIRAYYHENIPERKLSLMWKRMSDKRKEALSSGNIYTFDLMTEQERNSLLLRLQRPLSPAGIEGYAYQSRILYSMQAYEGQKVFDPILLHGVLIDEHFRGVIPVPEKGGQVRLQFDQAYGDGLLEVEELITIRWYGRKVTDRSSHTVTWTGAATLLEEFFDGGLLEISAHSPIVARAFLDEGDTSQEITPETIYSRGYVVDEEATVTYKVSHSNEEATPFRVGFRYIKTLSATNETSSAPTIVYELLNSQNKVVEQGSIPILSETSFYDRVAGEIDRNTLSDPITRYFSLPNHVTQIKFKSDNPALIFAHNRPAGMRHETKVPEHSYVSALDEWSQPIWFPVRPVGYENLILNNQSVLLIIQPQLPEDKPDLLAGRYQWEDYHPQGDWSARYIFTPLDDVESIREEAFVSVYRPITLGESEWFDFHTPQGVTSITPNLVYFRREDMPMDILMTVDGERFFHQRVDGLQGEIQLPRLMAGKRNIKVTTNASANIFINHTKPMPGGFLKRLANRFEQNKMRFVHERKNQEEESLSVRLYTPYEKEKRTNIKVQIDSIDSLPLTPMESWSVAAHLFDVRSGTIPVAVMGTQDEYVDYGYPFFITLGEDLPTGRYHLDFTIEKGVDSYLSLSKVTPGVFQAREIFYETEISHVKAIK